MCRSRVDPGQGSTTCPGSTWNRPDINTIIYRRGLMWVSEETHGGRSQALATMDGGHAGCPWIPRRFAGYPSQTKERTPSNKKTKVPNSIDSCSVLRVGPPRRTRNSLPRGVTTGKSRSGRRQVHLFSPQSLPVKRGSDRTWLQLCNMEPSTWCLLGCGTHNLVAAPF